MTTQVIGVGNLERCDDAAGLLVVRRLQELGIEATPFSGEALSLLDLWSASDRVILIDAVCTGSPAGSIVRWDACLQRVPRDAFRCSTHTFGVADAIEFAHILEQMPRELWIYGIEGRLFQSGSKPCKRVLAAVERLAREIARSRQSEAVSAESRSA